VFLWRKQEAVVRLAAVMLAVVMLALRMLATASILWVGVGGTI